MSWDTIVALSSGGLKAGIAVIRVSGPLVRFALETIAGAVPEPRSAELRRFRTDSGEVIDEGLVLFFPAPRSFTGEDVAEFHVHGGRAVIRGMLETLVAMPGVRLAERGEFSRRAVENGRLDLTAAEGIAALVDAETAAQRRQAVMQAGGALERHAVVWRDRLLRCLALVEAEIDFPDEEDVPSLMKAVREEAERILGEIIAALAGSKFGERLRDGVRIVIAGPPNAGKSTLMNVLAKRDVAIVSEIAGTTRDRIEVHLDVDGYPVTIVDTAGMRDTSDRIESMGVELAREAAMQSDLVLWLVPPDGSETTIPDFAGPVQVLETKADLFGSGAQHEGAIQVSALTGFGMDRLWCCLKDAARSELEGAENALVTRQRHREELDGVAQHLRRVEVVRADGAIEFLAEDIRLAVRGIGRLTGRVDIDEIYDVIFREFCIGK